MEILLGLLALGIFFTPFIAVLIFRRRLKNMEKRFLLLESRLAELEGPAPVISRNEAEEPVEPESEPETVRESGKTASPAAVAPRKPKSSRLSPFLKKLEKQFLDNWTGILGAVIVVLGAGFLSLYASLKMQEFARFLLLLLLAAIPAGLFFYLRRREAWQRQAAWFRSISGAIFLFACLGAGGIPGLQWIHNPFQSLALLTLGIIVNLGLSSLGGKQYFASFHTLLSLLALAIIPPGTASLFMALVVSLYGIIQTYRSRWDLHLLLTITGFFAYHLYWIFTLQNGGFTDLIRFQGAGTIIVLFLAAAFIHYRKNYATGRFEIFPFAVHMANWFYFSAGMILYAGQYQWRTIPLLLAALAAMFLAGLAEKKGIPWLRTTDYAIMQVLIVAALLTLKGWDMPGLTIWGLVFAETILFSRIMMMQGIFLLYRIGMILSYAGGGVLIGISLEASGREYSGSILPALASVLGLAQHRAVFKREDPRWLKGDTLPGLNRLKREFSLGGVFVGLFGLTAFANLWNLNIAETIVYPPGAALLAILLWGRKRNPSRGLTFGVGLFLFGFVLSGWGYLLAYHQVPHHWITGLSLLAACAAAIFSFYRTAKGEIFAWLLVTGSVLFMSFALLVPLSPLLPGISWLLLSAVLIILPKIPKRVRAMGLIFLGAYLLRHFAVQIHLEGMWGPVPWRYIMDLLPLPVFLLWYFKRPDKRFALILEAAILFVLPVLLIELSLSWIPLALEGLALIILMLGHMGREGSRLRIYSVFVNWLSIALLIAGVLTDPFDPLFPLGGALSMLAGLVYLVLLYRFARLDEIVFPSFMDDLKRFSRFLAGKFNPFILYPLILGGAVFIWDAASSETRTLFWALECFLIYGTSLFLREEHFRYISQGGLFLCVIRLILVDMSGSTVLVRGLVFLGVGVMMLGVNVLYNRYKERFQKDPD